LPEKIELSAEGMNKFKQAAQDYKDTLASYFKDLNVEIKDWKFAVENSEESYIIDASVKLQLKPKKKTK
jgi:hypothetical protein